MKKIYSRPELVYENFTLMESIARTCDPTEQAILKHDDVYSCYGVFEGEQMFTSGVTGCDTPVFGEFPALDLASQMS